MLSTAVSSRRLPPTTTTRPSGLSRRRRTRASAKTPQPDDKSSTPQAPRSNSQMRPPTAASLAAFKNRRKSALSPPTSSTTIDLDALCGGVVCEPPHLREWLDLSKDTIDNPISQLPAYRNVAKWFVDPADAVVQQAIRNPFTEVDSTLYTRAGPRERVVFRPEETRAAIVTCGGLCPGINTVVRELVHCLAHQYSVPVSHIFGVEGGYRGFYSRNLRSLNLDSLSDIHTLGGSVLGTSRGGYDTTKIVDSIADRKINQVYIIGGDGTQRGAQAIYKEVRRRGLKVAVMGVPKTIDNDVRIIDKSFGFDTAVEEAQRAINAANVEASSAVPNGVGLVKLMGRHAGFIAMHATLASRVVDLCLIPEVHFPMDGPEGVLEHVRARLDQQGKCVIVIAEGAGQEYLRPVWEGQSDGKAKDESGNAMLADIGLWLGSELRRHFQDGGNPITLKYIDPTYMIRAVPANGSDNIYCTLLAHSAVHGAMSGYTGAVVGPVNGRHAYIPVDRVTEGTRTVNPGDRMWARTVLSTRQPLYEPADPESDAKAREANQKARDAVRAAKAKADSESDESDSDAKATVKSAASEAPGAQQRRA